MPEIRALSQDLGPMLEGLEITQTRAKELTDALARSEGRYDLWVRHQDFGVVVNRRRIRPALKSPRDETSGPLPVKTGRFAAGWNWKIKGLNATVSNRVPYAAHARKMGEDLGTGVQKVERFLREDWERVALEIETTIAGWLL